MNDSTETAKSVTGQGSHGERKDAPDRVCIDPKSPYYHMEYHKLVVNFNGISQNRVHEFCISEGWIRREMTYNLRGKVYTKFERGKVVTVKLRGRVEAYFPIKAERLPSNM